MSRGGEQIPYGCGVDAAPYVLGALTEQEHESFLAHLRACPACREEVASLQPVASALPAAVPQLAAPSRLRESVMRTVRADAGLRSPGSRPRRARTRGYRPPWRLAFPGVAATVAAVLAAVLLLGGGSHGVPARTIRAQAPPRASATLRIASGHGTLQVRGMPRTPPGKVYEVWVKRSGGPLPTDALFSVSAGGEATVAVPGRMQGVRVVMVTAEPEGGSKVPTGRPVIVAEVS